MRRGARKASSPTYLGTSLYFFLAASPTLFGGSVRRLGRTSCALTSAALSVVPPSAAAAPSRLRRAAYTTAFDDVRRAHRNAAASLSAAEEAMDDETRRIRRERWLAASNAGGAGMGREDVASASASSVAIYSSAATSALASSEAQCLVDLTVGGSDDDADDALKPSRKRRRAVGSRQRDSPSRSALEASADGDEDDRGSDRERSRVSAVASNVSSKDRRKVDTSASSRATSRRAIDLTADSSDSDSSDGGAKASKTSWVRPRAVRPKGGSSSSSDSASRSTSSKNSSSSSSSSRRRNPTPFSLATYNVWFGPPHPEARMERIASVLSSSDAGGSAGAVRGGKPVFIGLQELTAPLASVLFPLLRSEGYDVVARDDLSGGGGYGCAVAVLMRAAGGGGGGAEVVRSGVRPYTDTIMGRGAVWAHARLGGEEAESSSPSSPSRSREVLFCTTHLESFVPNYPTPGRTYDGASQRRSQLREAASFCEEYARRNGAVDLAVIAGDLNWDDERKRGSKGNDPPLLSVLNGDNGGVDDSGWVDAWRQARGAEDGYTFDSRLSPMLRGNLRRRFDRCLIRSYRGGNGRGEPLRIKGAELIGTEPIEGLVWRKEKKRWGGGWGGSGGGTGEFMDLPVLPSDHFGLRVDFG